MGLNYSKNLVSSSVERSRFYTTMGGVDFSHDPSEISTSRFSHLENMYRDYEGEGAGLIESVPGFRVLAKLGENVRRIYLQRSNTSEEYLLLVTDTSLYRLPIGERDRADALVYIGELPSGDIVGFPFGDAFFFIAGKRMLRLNREGTLAVVGSGEGEVMPYIPTTYKNAQPYEQRNLLQSRFYETTVLDNPDEYSAKSTGLLFEITDETLLTCALSGRSHREEETLFVPSTVRLGSKIYTVTSVADGAFADETRLRAVQFSEGMREIGMFAFLRCSSLERVVFSDSVTSIKSGAFDYCSSLTHVHFGEEFSQSTLNYFDFCTSLRVLNFSIS